MIQANERFIHDIMSGRQRGFLAGAARCALAAAEPFYSAAMIARNRLFDAELKPSVRLPRPVISIGNITAGGAGKTPMVRWLANRLRSDGLQVAILARGYKSAAIDRAPRRAASAPSNHSFGDEQIMLDRMLNAPGMPEVVLRANPNRVASAQAVLRDRPQTSLFLLDDGFQHRRVKRELDIVLINATEPFGFGHVLPRGLLREPLSGLRRADAVVITHADEAEEAAIAAIEQQVRAWHRAVPIYRARHKPVGVRSAAASSALPADRTIAELQQRPFFAFCGIGDPAAFLRQMRAMGRSCRGGRSFPDHHGYTPGHLHQLKTDAESSGADLLLTTEKDWVKIESIAAATAGLPDIWRIDVELGFESEGEQALYDQVRSAITRGSSPITPVTPERFQ